MARLFSSLSVSTVSGIRLSWDERYTKAQFVPGLSNKNDMKFGVQCNGRVHRRKLPKNIRYPRRAELPPEPQMSRFLNGGNGGTEQSEMGTVLDEEPEGSDDGFLADGIEGKEEGDIVWDTDEIEVISSLFRGRIPQKPGNLNRERPHPLPLPYKLRPMGLPIKKRHVRAGSSLSKQVYKNPDFLISIAREIRNLPLEDDVSSVLNKWARFLRKASLSLTIRELGHMGLPERALQTFFWTQKQPHLFPDDRILASTVEVLARNHKLKVPFSLEKFTGLASRSVIEALARGFIRRGSLSLVWKLLLVSKDSKRMLGPSIYAKLILELGKNPDKHSLVLALLEELGEREDLKLSHQDCTAVMKVCIRLGKFEIVESLFNWYKQAGNSPSVVMYTTLIHSRYTEKKYREALAVVWEMEASDCLFDLPAYRVVIKLLIALNDLSRTGRYFSKLKEAGFSPTYDIYRDMLKVYMVFRRLAMCREVCRELEMAGFKLDKETSSKLLQLEKENR